MGGRWAIYRLVKAAALVAMVACSTGSVAHAADNPRCSAYAAAIMQIKQAQASIDESVEFCKSHPTLPACAPGGTVELARKMASPTLMPVAELCRRAAEEDKKR